MKYTIFTQFESSFLYSGNMAIVLDYANEIAESGHKVSLVYCDSEPHHTCWHNMSSDKSICRICMKYRELLLRKLNRNITLIPTSAYKDFISMHEKDELTTIEDLKKIEYRGVKIGYAVLSSYLTMSRNLNPLFDRDFIGYMNLLLSLTRDYTDIVYAIIEETKPDIIGAYNARIVYSRPVIDVAVKLGIKHLCYETAFNTKNEHVKITFNDTPHSVKENMEIINKIWDSDVFTREEKIKIAEQFFFKRRHAIKAGDKIYVKDQVLGLLPQGFDEGKHNILILNSSEDEFAAISDEFEHKSLFRNQLEAIKYISEHYKDNKDYHFYLKIHPNLKDIPYRYHTDLLKLFNDYDNFTVIPGNSKISTYALIDNCDKVIVFGSTTGPEAVYWGKPTILLTYCIYSLLDICYTPANLGELDDLVLNKVLSPKDKQGSLKYAYYRMNNEFEDVHLYKFQIKNINFLGRHFELCVYDCDLITKLSVMILQILGKRRYYKKLWFPTREKEV